MNKVFNKINKIVSDGRRRSEIREIKSDENYRKLNDRIYLSKKGDIWFYDLLNCNMRFDLCDNDSVEFIGGYCGYLDLNLNRNVWDRKTRQEIIDGWNQYILAVNIDYQTSWAFAVTKGTTRKIYNGIMKYGIENVFDDEGVPYPHILED